MAIKTEPFVLNIGPVHPSTHGVFRMRAVLDGEVITDLEPVFGYLHRGIEKLAEERTYTGIIPLTDRLDYLASMSNNLAYVLAVEKLAGIAVPERAEYLRVILAELQRIVHRHRRPDPVYDDGRDQPQESDHRARRVAPGGARQDGGHPAGSGLHRRHRRNG